MLNILHMMRDLQIGVLKKDGQQSDCYRIPQAAPIAFKALLAFLIFVSASSRSAYTQSQTTSAFEDCQKHIFECLKQLVTMTRQNQSQAASTFNPVFGEGLLSIMLENLQNKHTADGGAFHLTELYNEYAVKLVGGIF